MKVLRSEGDGGAGGDVVGTPTPEVTNIEKTGWLAAVSDDIFNNHKEDLAKHTNINTVLKEHFSDKEKYKEAIIKPTEKSTPEEWKLYRERMQIPLDSNGYVFDAVPEGATDNKDFETLFRSTAHELNLSADQGKGFFKAFKEMEAAGAKAQAEDLAKKKGEAEISMRAEYGSNYDTIMRKSGLVTALGGPEFVEFLNTSGLGSRHEFIKAIGVIANMVSEDSLGSHQPGGGNSGEKKTLAQRLYPEQK